MSSKEISQILRTSGNSKTLFQKFKGINLADPDLIGKTLSSLWKECLVACYHYKKNPNIMIQGKLVNKEEIIHLKVTSINFHLKRVKEGKGGWFQHSPEELKSYNDLLKEDRRKVVYELNFDSIFHFFTLPLKSEVNCSYETICDSIRFVRKYCPMQKDEAGDFPMNPAIDMIVKYDRYDYHTVICYLHNLLDWIDNYVFIKELLDNHDRSSHVVMVPNVGYNESTITSLPNISLLLKSYEKHKNRRPTHLKQGTIYQVSYLEMLEDTLLKGLLPSDVNKEMLVKDYKNMEVHKFVILLKELSVGLLYNSVTKSILAQS
jgi:hypothetical protein